MGSSCAPFGSDDVFLALIQIRKPVVFSGFAYTVYAALWFTTPFFLMSLLTSVLAIAVYRRAPAARFRKLLPTQGERGGRRPFWCWVKRICPRSPRVRRVHRG